MDIIVKQNPGVTSREFSGLELDIPSLKRKFTLDVDFSAILNMSWRVDRKALDFMVIAAVVFAIDKIASRKKTHDRWTRTLNISMPLQFPEAWKPAADMLAQSVSFLTGDSWHFRFTQAATPFYKRRSNRRKKPLGFPQSPVVALLSGGLDSFAGALDLMAKHPGKQILFVSHYDGDVAGPASDQTKLCSVLEKKFPGCVTHLKVRVGLRRSTEKESQDSSKYDFETTFRSRSLIFLGLAIYAAAKTGKGIPVVIPENGPIALNMPLNPSRRGSCSTRTVHPYFLASLQKALTAAGIRHTIINPYELKTKGEILVGCQHPDLLKSAYPLTNSCGKAGRRTHWKNKTARACGACVPCLFRRASLHAIGCDDELFGHDVFAGRPEEYPDFHALIGLIRRKPNKNDIARDLVANGRFPIDRIDGYVDVVSRMITEVKNWLSAKAPASVCALAGIVKAQ